MLVKLDTLARPGPAKHIPRCTSRKAHTQNCPPLPNQQLRIEPLPDLITWPAPELPPLSCTLPAPHRPKMSSKAPPRLAQWESEDD